jgi:hypothetical protein
MSAQVVKGKMRQYMADAGEGLVGEIDAVEIGRT